MHLELTPKRAQALVACLDLAIKAMGIRAMEEDILDLMSAVRASVEPAVAQDASSGEQG